MKKELIQNQGTAQKAVKASVWVVIIRISDKALQFIKLIIVARILSPEDFGLFGIALLSLTFLENFSEMGIYHSLIQKRGDVKPYLNTAWVSILLRNILLGLILIVSSDFLAKFFGQPAISPLIKVLSIYIFLQGFYSIYIFNFQKNFEFKKQFYYQFSSTLIDTSVTILLALIFKNFWALVLGAIAGNLSRLIISYLIYPYKPEFSFNLGYFKEIFKFGKWVMIGAFTIYFATQGDTIFVGKYLGIEKLAHYSMAYSIATIISSEIAGIVSKVAFPLYAKIQEDRKSLSSAYLRILGFSIFITIPIAGCLFVLAPDLVKVILGDKWLPITPILQIFSIAGIFHSITSTGGAFFYGIGKPKLDFYLNLIRMIIMFLLIYPFTVLWGITGSAFAVLIAIFCMFLYWLWSSLKNADLHIISVMKKIYYPLIATFILALIIYFIRSYYHFNSLTSLVFFAILGVIMYFGITVLYEAKTEFKMISEIKYIYKNLTN